MEHSEFEIGMEFYSGATLWRCTDVGSRTIVAVEVKDGYPAPNQAPPFSDAVEIVFDDLLRSVGALPLPVPPLVAPVPAAPSSFPVLLLSGGAAVD